MKLMNVKGTFDYMPEDMAIRNRITDVLRKNFKNSCKAHIPAENTFIMLPSLLKTVSQPALAENG